MDAVVALFLSSRMPCELVWVVVFDEMQAGVVRACSLRLVCFVFYVYGVLWLPMVMVRDFACLFVCGACCV